MTRTILGSASVVLCALAFLDCNGAATTDATPNDATDAPVDTGVDVPLNNVLIGPSGGSFQGCGTVVTIPPGAVTSAMTFGVVTSTTPPPAGYTTYSPVCHFRPDGVVFAMPVTVAMQFQGDPSMATMYWSRPSGPGYDDLGGTVSGMTLTAQVTHFSTGFVGARMTMTDAGDVPLPNDVTDVVDATDASDVQDTGVDVPTMDAIVDAGMDVPAMDANDAAADTTPTVTYCSLGSDVPGAVAPSGFCVREYIAPSMLREPRVLAVASNGDLFVSAPAAGTGAGVSGGPASIMIVSDDNHDGVGELSTFASGLADVHGMAFGSDGLYFTTTAGIWRTNYVSGQRMEDAASRVMIAGFTNSAARWTHGLGITPGNAIYATTGVWGAACPDTNVGTIDRVSMGSLTMQASGFRNPMYIRCHYRDEACLVTELGDDGGGGYGAHEKMLAIHSGTNYGYPCCAGADEPASGVATAQCSASVIQQEEVAFALNSTPFGMDWERGLWPAPYTNAVFLAFHGSFYSSPAYLGTRIAYANVDPTTDAPNVAFTDFLTGFGPTSPQMRRATDVTFGADGRMFFIDDLGGGVYYVAPTTLMVP